MLAEPLDQRSGLGVLAGVDQQIGGGEQHQGPVGGVGGGAAQIVGSLGAMAGLELQPGHALAEPGIAWVCSHAAAQMVARLLEAALGDEGLRRRAVGNGHLQMPGAVDHQPQDLVA